MKQDFSETYQLIGLNIAYYRKRKGYTQLQLADMINISRTHMSNIEAPGIDVAPSLDVLLSIANVLEIPAYKLLFDPNS